MKKGAIIFLTGVLAFSSLPSIAADSPSVQVGFSPEGSAQTLVIGAIDSAQSSIRMMAYSWGLTLSGTKTHVKQRFLPLTPLLMVSDVLWSPVLPA